MVTLRELIVYILAITLLVGSYFYVSSSRYAKSQAARQARGVSK
jgi:hypothetical protein